MADANWQMGKRIAPPRFALFIVLLIAATALASVWLSAAQAAIAGFDAAAAIFLVSLTPLFDDEADEMRRAAATNDANRVLLLAITGLVMVVILAAVAVELSEHPARGAIVLVIGTLVLAWLFSNTIYALHYAHLFYLPAGGHDAGGLDFPDTSEPDYWDFVYFAYTLGMTFQTSDVTIGGRHMRRIVVFHCLAAFVFNLGVLAFTINVLGG